MSDGGQSWFTVDNIDEIESPSLLIYRERVEENIRRMIAIAGDARRLRPHVKTHKLGPIIAMQMAAGIRKFKAATIAEAEILGRAAADDALLAYQPVGPAARRWLDLIEGFPKSRFSCLLDDADAANHLSQMAAARGMKVNVLLDIDCGQHRTGIPADDSAVEFYKFLCKLPGISPIGLHAYDGHIRAENPAQRKEECDAAFAPVVELRKKIESLGLPGRTIVAGGTPTFPFHARRENVECSPGTCVLWDMAYSNRFADMEFLHAALVLTRVVSKPGQGRLCVDLGHKAIASENPHPRVHFLNAPHAQAISHSEEHLLLDVKSSADWKTGDCLFGVPSHVCPTVALYSESIVVRQQRAVDRWRIEARDRRLHF